MYVEETGNNRYAIKELTADELFLLAYMAVCRLNDKKEDEHFLNHLHKEIKNTLEND